MSWWYLYNEDRELDALILEINNSYWEKRNILLRIKPTSDKLRQPESLEAAKYIDMRQSVRSLPTATKAKFYGGEWHKYVFASPFEKVDGLVSQRMMDPLNPGAWTSDATFSNMTTLEESGEVRMATRLTCDGSPIDPTMMSWLDVIKLVLQWTLPGIMTTPEIIFKALKIRFLGQMKMNSKPPVRSGSVGRPIRKLEMYVSQMLCTTNEKSFAHANLETLNLTFEPIFHAVSGYTQMPLSSPTALVGRSLMILSACARLPSMVKNLPVYGTSLLNLPTRHSILEL